MASERLTHIDALRGLAVLLMVMVHAAATWAPSINASPSLGALVISGLGGLAAPLFITVFGWGVLRGDSTPCQRWIRAGVLLVCQVVVNLTSPHLFRPFTPGVLSLFALLVLLQPLWSRPLRETNSPVRIFFGACLGIGLLIGLLPGLQGSSSWAVRVAAPDFATLSSHALLTGTYPLIPWVLFALFGGVIAQTDPEGLVKRLNRTVVVGFLVSTWFLWQSWRTQTVWALPTGEAMLTFFPANIPFLFAALTGVALLWRVSLQAFTKAERLASVGRLSLTVYVTHFLPLTAFQHLEVTYAWGLNQAGLAAVVYAMMAGVTSAVWYHRCPQWSVEHGLRQLERIGTLSNNKNL